MSELRGDPTAFADLFDELFSLLFAAHRRAAAGGRPDRRDHGTNHKTLRRDLVSEPFQFILADVDVDVRVEKKNVHSVELDAVHFGLRCQIEHRVQIDERFGAGAAGPDLDLHFADPLERIEAGKLHGQADLAVLQERFPALVFEQSAVDFHSRCAEDG